MVSASSWFRFSTLSAHTSSASAIGILTSPPKACVSFPDCPDRGFPWRRNVAVSISFFVISFAVDDSGGRCCDVLEKCEQVVVDPILKRGGEPVRRARVIDFPGTLDQPGRLFRGVLDRHDL